MSATAADADQKQEPAHAGAPASTELIRTHDSTAVLSVQPNQAQWTEGQKAVLRSLGLDEASNADFGALLHASQRYQLDPFAKQISMVSRNAKTWENGKEKWVKKYSILVLMDGYLALASRTGRFLGIDGPFWLTRDKEWVDYWVEDYPPLAARVTVRFVDRTGQIATQTATVTYKSRAQLRDGKPQAMWATMPDELLANGAIRKALRLALPEALDTVLQDLEISNGYLDDLPGTPTSAPVIEGNVVPESRVMVSAGRPDPEDPFGLDDPANAGGAAVLSNSLSTGEDVVEATADDVDADVMSEPQQRSTITRLSKQLGLSDDQRHARTKELYEVESTKELTYDQAEDLISRLRRSVAKQAEEAARKVGAMARGNAEDLGEFDLQGGAK